MIHGYYFLCLLVTSVFPDVRAYDIVQDHSGTSFFDKWDFYGSWDNLTNGDVNWLSRDDAFGQNLVSTNGAGNALLRVDNTTTVPWNDKRNSVRITSQIAYSVGSLWVADIVHLPFGCSVWPAFWTMGPMWPQNGEIDIIEGINLMDHNQMALHSNTGCIHTTPTNQIGTSGETNCSQPSGCIVAETKPNSFGPAFAANGGGVFAAQFDVAGIFMWFWPRSNIPSSIVSSGPTTSHDLSDWGNPSAGFPATSCNISQFFGPQQLVLDITLCGSWAGLPNQYQPQCNSSGPTGICYNDNVVGPGNRYDNAYFEIRYVRTYTTTTGTPISTSTTAVGAVQTTTSSSEATQSRLSSTAARTGPWRSGIDSVILTFIVEVIFMNDIF